MSIERFREWLWINTRGRFEEWWDGHPIHTAWWDATHSKELWWSPDWTFHLTKRNPLFWLVTFHLGRGDVLRPLDFHDEGVA